MRSELLHLLYWLSGITLCAQTPADTLLQTEEEAQESAVVVGRVRAQRISLDVEHKEVISMAGLQKMACCTVAESFENSASVTAGYSDAVSGTRQIRMLGLAGIYTQLLDESRPVMRGLGQPYALTYTPGAWLSGISVSKGTASVMAGHDALSGQINMEHRKPTDDERLHVNFYLNDMLRPDLNITTAWPLTKNKSLSTILLLHGSADTEWREMNAMDRDKDGFRDQPRTQEFYVANKWFYLSPAGVQLRWGAKLGMDDRLGGVTHYDGSHAMRQAMLTDWDKPGTHYGSDINNLSTNAYFKLAIPVGRERTSSNGETQRNNVAIVADFDHFGATTYFGLNDYRAEENSLWLNAIYNHFVSSKTTLMLGLQSRLGAYNERLFNRTPWVPAEQGTERNFLLRRNENEIGAYGELTAHPTSDITIVAGLRGDYNDYFNTFGVTPRAHLKWGIAQRTTLRASIGWGYRTANVISDNIGILATGRQIAFDNQPINSPAAIYTAEQFKQFDRREKALTWGMSLLQKFSLAGDDNASISADFFRTRFMQSVIADQEFNPAYIYIYSTKGLAYSNNWQADFNWTPFERFDVMCTFRYTQSRHTLTRPDGSQVRVERALQSKYKGLINLQYATHFRRWVFDVTAQLNGPARIPSPTADLYNSTDSPAYAMFYAQITHRMRLFDLYAGCENIADYRQDHPIQNSENPFSTAFNSLNVWGPLMGRTFYIGFRLNLY